MTIPQIPNNRTSEYHSQDNHFEMLGCVSFGVGRNKPVVVVIVICCNVRQIDYYWTCFHKKSPFFWSFSNFDALSQASEQRNAYTKRKTTQRQPTGRIKNK